MRQHIENLWALHREISKGYKAKLERSIASFKQTLAKLGKRDKGVVSFYDNQVLEIEMEYEENHNVAEAAAIAINKIQEILEEYIAEKKTKKPEGV
ncbi:hypothetical protein R83H12_02552 [Fibrobacteria bacterium R8-3-H12]